MASFTRECSDHSHLCPPPHSPSHRFVSFSSRTSRPRLMEGHPQTGEARFRSTASARAPLPYGPAEGRDPCTGQGGLGLRCRAVGLCWRATVLASGYLMIERGVRGNGRGRPSGFFTSTRRASSRVLARIVGIFDALPSWAWRRNETSRARSCAVAVRGVQWRGRGRANHWSREVSGVRRGISLCMGGGVAPLPIPLPIR